MGVPTIDQFVFSKNGMEMEYSPNLFIEIATVLLDAKGGEGKLHTPQLLYFP